MNPNPVTHALSASQQLLWELMRAVSPDDPGATPEVAVAVREVLGPLDTEAFRAAVADVAARHEPLRLTFHALGDEPRVAVEPAVEAPVRFHDLTGLPADRRRRALAALHAEATGAPFDLRRPPLWRVELVRLAPERHVLVAVFFHLVADGWSTRLFVDDVVACYRSRTGRCPAPAAVGAGFADIAAHQARALAGTPDRLGFWRRALRPVPRPVPFPARPVSPETDVRAAAATRFRLPEHVGRRLRGVAWQARSTEYVALMAAYHLLLRRHVGTERITVGTTTLGRPDAPARRLIGQFTNDVYVVADIGPEQSLLDTVRQVHHGLATAMRNAVAFRDLAGAANPDVAGQRPWPDIHLFDSYLQAEPPAAPELVTEELRIRQIAIDAPDVGAGFDAEAEGGAGAGALPAGRVPESRLPVWRKKGAPIMILDDDRRGGALVRNPGFFDDGLAEQLVAEYLEIVEALAEDPTRRVAALLGAPRRPGRARRGGAAA